MNRPDAKEDGALPAKVTAAEHLDAADVDAVRGAPHPGVPTAQLNATFKKKKKIK